MNLTSKESVFKKNFFSRASIIIIGVTVLFYVLWLGANFLIPLVLSFFLAFAILTTFHFFKDKFQLPNFLVAIITISIFLGIFYIIGHIINNNIVKIVELAPEYEDKIVKIVNGLLGQFGLEQTFSFDNYIKSIDIPTLLGNVGAAFRSLIGYAGTIMLYIAFILAEHTFIANKIQTLASLTPKPKTMLDIMGKIKKDVSSYFVIHTLVSMTTGFGTFLICFLFGVDFAPFWGLLAFMLNYIPTIGSIVGWAIPSLFSIIQYGSTGEWGMVLGVVTFLGINQFLIGNVIEPKFLGSRLNLSPLVILLSLTFWGYIWGIIGMFLSIPIMVTLNIIFSHFDSTKWLYVLMSETGKLPDDR